MWIERPDTKQENAKLVKTGCGLDGFGLLTSGTKKAKINFKN